MFRPYIRPLKIIFASLWISLLLLTLALWWRSGIALTAIPALLEHWLIDFGVFKAAAVYVVLYAVRPLILFPATLLTVASGLIFGPWLGTLFTIVGENVSANLAFVLARWFGRQLVVNHSTESLLRWDKKLEHNAIMAVLTMRLIMLPFDVVNFGCGLTAIRQRDYAIGTFFGILPSLIGFVLLGGIASASEHNQTLTIILSLLFMILGFGLAQLLKRRERKVQLTT